MKAARALLLSLSILLVLIFGAGAWLVASESGLRSLVKVANSLAGSSFQVAAVKGRLLGPLQLSQLSLQLTDIDLSIDQIDLQWSPKALWSSKIHINKLHIQNGNLAMRSSDTATEPSNTDLTILNKIAVSIDELAIQQWQLQTDEQAPFILDTGHLSAAWSKGVLAVKKFELHTPQGQLSAAGDLGLFKTAKLPFQCTVDWQIPTLQK